MEPGGCDDPDADGGEPAGGAFSIPVIGIMVALLLQALNIVLAIFSPSIHAMRLHIVVFFSKFYEGGGGKYRPFRKTVVEEAGD